MRKSGPFPLAPGSAATRRSLTTLTDPTDALRTLGSVFVGTLRACVVGRREPGALTFQMYEIGYRSTGFLCIVMGFVGMILVYQGGLQTQRVLPDLSQLGTNFVELLVRDLAASICALMLATRVGAAIAAELGNMCITEQLDALRMCAADPINYLVRPRFLASIVMTTVLVVLAGAVAYVTGMWTAQAFFDVPPRTFVNLRLVDATDLAAGLTKCVCYGAAIPIISAYCGLTARGGSEGVGWAATRAVVLSSLAVISLNFVISAFFLVVFE